MLRLKNVKKDYVTSSETVHALKGIDLSFRGHEFVSILGPSGCGKTTLLNIVGGLDHYTDGDLVINGKSTRVFNDRDWDVYRNHRVGFIFQSYNLIPHQTVLGNVELALTIAGISKEERVRRAKEALDRVGLSDQYYKRPNQLSGGQCQRVAIARALVNDPEILLADEPTGALDTVTSVQIMDLIREIARERLVIMVTHNPELAEQYSTRIIRLLDGEVIEDSNPYSEEEEIRECRRLRREKMRRARELCRGKQKKERAKMSAFTAFRLSARNLLSKRGRTTVVGFAGSIGIIGIALVLAFSAGIKGYIASMQDDMLSGNPITITESTYDLNALMGMMTPEQKVELIREPNRVYIDSLIEYMTETFEKTESLRISNTLTEEYVNYVLSMPKEYYAAMKISYGIDPSLNIYTDFYPNKGGESESHSINALRTIYSAILGKTDFSSFSSFITALVSTFQQAPNDSDYILSQYNILDGKLATEKGEIMLVVSKDQALSDLVLANLGYYAQDEFLNIIDRTSESESYDPALDRDFFSYEEMMSKTFYWYPNDAIYTATGNEKSPFSYNAHASELNSDGAVELKVVGILQPKETVQFGCLSAGIYYTEALTEHMLGANMDSEIVNYLNEHEDLSGQFTSTEMSFGTTTTRTGIFYPFTYTYDGVTYNEYGLVGSSFSMGTTKTASLSLRQLGGDSLANGFTIYPPSFDSMHNVTAYLDAWNGDGTVTVGDATITADDREDVTYTDTLSIIITILNTMIDIISYALIAFTSISLVVSTVMIGIITYVSVVERIKEIGVIRALGGRKKDVSRLFRAETFIIGLLSGLFGIGLTYGICWIASTIVQNLTGVANIALLPVTDAIALIVLSILLTSISGILPASSAAKKDPVVALRTE